MILRASQSSHDVRAAVSTRLQQLAEQWSPPMWSGDPGEPPSVHGPDSVVDVVGRSASIRWDRRRTRAVLVVLAVAVLAAAWTWWQGRPIAVESLASQSRADAQASADSVAVVTPASSAAPVQATMDGGTPAPRSEVIVHVVGAVASPGVVHLPAGSRVDDAIAAVGGARPAKALASVNLARVLVDGEQIIVDSAGLAATSGGPRLAMVSLNSAHVAELESLPGVGPVLAQRIVEWRMVHGPFHSIDELSEVTGIGAALMGDLKKRVQL